MEMDKKPLKMKKPWLAALLNFECEAKLNSLLFKKGGGKHE